MAKVRGYASKTSVRPGETLEIRLSADPAGSRTITVERLSGTTLPVEMFSVPLSVPLQPEPPDRGWEGYSWSTVFLLAVPHWWPSGLYSVRSGTDLVLDFVVRATTPGAFSTILLQVSVNTPHAYANTGGKSLYEFNSNAPGRASWVSYDRPDVSFQSELPMIQWLNAEGIDVEYCTSVDLHQDPSLLDHYALLLIAGHDEYWSRDMRDHVERFVRNGGNLAILSGNSCYRQVRLEGPGLRRLVCFKQAGSDSVPDVDALSVAWSTPPLHRPPNRMMGVGFTHGAGCWDKPGLQPAASYAVRFPTHWVFAGLSSPTFAQGLIGYETDATAFLDEPEGYPRVTCEDNAPPDLVVLASADLRHWGPGGKPGMATMTLFSDNGSVFNAATVSWQAGLGGSTADADVQTITRNVIQRFRTRRPWNNWETIGSAPGPAAMTALEGRLFLATTTHRLLRRFPMAAEAPWTDIGHLFNARSLSAAAGKLWTITTDNRLWWRSSAETDTPWTDAGTGPAAGTLAIAGTAFLLYAVDTAGVLWMAPARTPVAWERVPKMGGFFETRINAMAAADDVLFAATTDGRLLRTNAEFVYEAFAWADVGPAPDGKGLAHINNKLYLASGDQQLRWWDLRGLRLP